MKIKSSVINKYMELCPVSTNKCESFTDIEYKIERAVTLGQVIEIRKDEFVIGYYYLQFVLKNDEVVDMFRNKNTKYINVSEKIKSEYDQINLKIVV